ncbi:helix-hairpin-helix domain-containing protein [Pseudoduganella sp. S-14]|jgi:hypothetical protein|uniref:helix-hairpin-helix domain-containing protein n=1 Tax=Pseudoduganella sp. S-14 TaxID=3404065 RepID=UPI003CF50417
MNLPDGTKKAIFRASMGGDAETVIGTRHAPCVLDVLMSVTDFLGGGVSKPWWHFTELRQRKYGNLQQSRR